VTRRGRGFFFRWRGIGIFRQRRRARQRERGERNEKRAHCPHLKNSPFRRSNFWQEIWRGMWMNFGSGSYKVDFA
jgi:hypothetical protein